MFSPDVGQSKHRAALPPHCSTVTDLFLHCKEFDDVLVVEFLQDLELSHLDVQRPQEAQVVEHFDCVQVARFLRSHQETRSQTHVTLSI